MTILFRVLLLLVTLSSNLWANEEVTNWYTLEPNNNVIINVEMFISSTCPYCHKMDAYFHKIEPQNPWLHVKRYTINEDKDALIRFNKLLNEQQMSDFSVPSLFFCNSRWVGYVSDETTGKDLLLALQYCKKQIEEKEALTPEAVTVLKRWANASLFDSNMDENPSVSKYITVLALIDATNPCALFAIIAFFAVLFMQDKRKGILLIGLIFLLGLGTLHYLQQVYANLYFSYLPWLRLPAVFIGLLSLYMAYEYYKKPIFRPAFLPIAFLLAVVISAYQQTCVMNWSYVFEQWLSNQQVTETQKFFYQLSYQSLYLVSLVLTLIFFHIAAGTKTYKKILPGLQRVSAAYFAIVAILLVIYPYLLANFLLSLGVMLTLLIIGIIMTKKINRNL